MGTRFDPATGSVIFLPQEKTNEVIIQSVDDFPTTIDSGKVYFIDGLIDMGDTEITVPTGGMYIDGHGYGISGLYSASNSKTLFKTGGGTYAGDFIVTGCTFYMTGTSSKIFDLDNDENNGAFELNSCNLGTFSATTTSLGSISNYRQIRTGDFAAIKYLDGFTFNGNIGGMALNDSIILADQAGVTFLQEGTLLSITSGMSSDMNGLSMTATSTWCDFDEANFATGAALTLTGFRTSATDALPNLPSTSIKAVYKGCIGIDNTFIGASWSLTSEAATTVTTNKTLVKLAGTTTLDTDAHFDDDGGTSNRLKYLGEKNIKVDVIGYMQLSSGSTESFEIEARQWDSSASSWIDLRTLPIETALKILGDRRGGGTIVATAILSQNDYIELWALDASAAGTANPTLELESTLTVSERQS